MADTDDCLSRVDKLLAHPDFSLKNPNKVGALVGVFAGNLRRFHAADGAGYRWLADRILEVLARRCGSVRCWPRVCSWGEEAAEDYVDHWILDGLSKLEPRLEPRLVAVGASRPRKVLQQCESELGCRLALAREHGTSCHGEREGEEGGREECEKGCE